MRLSVAWGKALKQDKGDGTSSALGLPFICLIRFTPYSMLLFLYHGFSLRHAVHILLQPAATSFVIC